MTDSGLQQDVASHHHQLRETKRELFALETRVKALEERLIINIETRERISTLESQVTELATILDTLTDKLIEAGVLVKRKGK